MFIAIMKTDITLNSIIFVQREIEDKLGPMVLSAHLKAYGHRAAIIINPHKNMKTLQKMQPAFVGISVLTPSVSWALEASDTLKKYLPNSLIILGGPHPTFFPEVIRHESIDLICIGEGEKPLLNLLSSYDGTVSSIKNTPNCWVKENGSIISKNSLIPLLSEEELTQLPFCDRTHYSDYSSLRYSPHKKIWTSRGCPFSCSYCFNYKYKQLYKGLGKMIRQRSVDSVIAELRDLKKYGWKCLEIVDDHFLTSRDWLYEFCEKYVRYINLPFACNFTAKQISNDIVVALKKAGCKTICFAIESGNQSIRKKAYNKPITNEEIYNAADILNSHNMPFLTFNMIGLPEESMDDIYQTIAINQKINTTYPWCSILQPYPGTQISEYITGQDIDFKKVFTYSYFSSSVIGDLKKRKIISNAQKLFAYFVKSKANYNKVCSLAQNPPLNIDKFFSLMFYWHYGNDIRKRYGLDWLSLFRYWLYSH